MLVVTPKEVACQKYAAGDGPTGFLEIAEHALKCIGYPISDESHGTNPRNGAKYVVFQEAPPVHSEAARQRTKDGA